ncbi:MAG: ComF family protein [Myxococcota bacterium]
MLDVLTPLRWLVAPARCVGCNEISRAPFCAECEPNAPQPIADEIEGRPLLAAGIYAGPLAAGIRRFKYVPQPDLAARLAALLTAPAERMRLPKSTLWVPVPLHYARLVERGFNQSALLARALARTTGTRFEANLLKRTRETTQQAQLERAERLLNTQDAFEVRGRTDAEVVLIDDVVTSGATVTSCIFALAQKGVKVRAVFTLARTHPL